MSYDRRFITPTEQNTISSLMLKKGINDKSISRRGCGFHRVSDFRSFMKGQKIIEENYIKELIKWLKSL